MKTDGLDEFETLRKSGREGIFSKGRYGVPKWLFFLTTLIIPSCAC